MFDLKTVAGASETSTHVCAQTMTETQTHRGGLYLRGAVVIVHSLGALTARLLCSGSGLVAVVPLAPSGLVHNTL